MNITVDRLTIHYGGRAAVNGVSLDVASGELVAIVGPNGSGKTTLLRGMSRLIKPSAGRVLLGGDDVRSLSARAVARRMAVLPQLHDSGEDLTVRELVWRGRYPHQGVLQRATQPDYEAVAWALEAADVEGLAERALGSLSGGERQRAWIALALAQQPQVLLLDEPTSFLDIRHQMEILELIARLNREGMTVVAIPPRSRHSRALRAPHRGAPGGPHRLRRAAPGRTATGASGGGLRRADDGAHRSGDGLTGTASAAGGSVGPGISGPPRRVAASRARGSRQRRRGRTARSRVARRPHGARRG